MTARVLEEHEIADTLVLVGPVIVTVTLPCPFVQAPLSDGVVSLVTKPFAGEVSVTTGMVLSMVTVCAADVPVPPAASLCAAVIVDEPSADQTLVSV